ncbi:protein PATRONUS 2-like [Cannabis sativa]|uniref:protein PATRONUS 2-like n=1 Tax=Cannabis sativa TaxID=3483 RepID=UPI0029CA5613|nr:protein PATRONUS 2-like [Cannabis sativa]XP_060971354.1 protein PATRONUS 2-like [Cannabis sativa]
MASQLAHLFQDQNFNAQYGASAGGKMNAIKPGKNGKGGLSGRKPLGEISNSANIAPPLAHASKKHNSKNFASTNEVAHEKSTAKTSDKVETRSRKALSDISNSVKPHLHQAPKNRQNIKAPILDDYSFPSCIAEEQFLHDHQKCIKANATSEMNDFFNTIGLKNVSLKQVDSPKSFSKSMKNQLEFVEIPEFLEDEYLWKQNTPPKTPKSPNYNASNSLDVWTKDFDYVNFKLL